MCRVVSVKCILFLFFIRQAWINQRQICVRIKALLHRYRIDSDHYFQRRGYIRRENVTSLRCTM